MILTRGYSRVNVQFHNNNFNKGFEVLTVTEIRIDGWGDGIIDVVSIVQTEIFHDLIIDDNIKDC